MPPPSVCVLGDWDGEGLASIFGLKNYDWFPMIREMQIETMPGTALFTGSEGSHGHVGLYIGNGEVIEAQGTKAGVNNI